MVGKVDVKPLENGISESKFKFSIAFQGFAGYCQQSSLHGWQYLVSERSKWQKAAWMVIFLTFSMFGVIFTYSNILEYTNSATVTSITSTTASLKDIYIPTFVLCNVNQVTVSFLNSINITDLPHKKFLFDHFVTGFESEETVDTMDNDVTLMDIKNRLSSVHGWNESIFFQSIAGQNCEDMVLATEWKYTYSKSICLENCNSSVPYFNAINDYGSCCLIEPHILFEIPWTGEYSWTAIEKGASNGQQNGLRVMLDIESFDLGDHQSGSYGFQAVVNIPFDKALTNQQGFYIAPGEETLITMAMTYTNTSDEALTLEPHVRDCYKSDEVSLKFLRPGYGYNYSMINCLYDKLMVEIIEHCNCAPGFTYYDPKDNENVILDKCHGKNLACAQAWIKMEGRTFHDQASTQNKSNTNDFKCLQNCQHQTNKLMVTSSPYPSKLTLHQRRDFCIVMKKIVQICRDPHRKVTFEAKYRTTIRCSNLLNAYNQDGMCKQKYLQMKHFQAHKSIVDFVHSYTSENVAVVKMYIRDSYYTKITRDREMTFTSFIGNAGGLLGLCIGFSGISLMEIIYHLFSLMIKSFQRKN